MEKNEVEEGRKFEETAARIEEKMAKMKEEMMRMMTQEGKWSTPIDNARV